MNSASVFVMCDGCNTGFVLEKSLEGGLEVFDNQAVRCGDRRGAHERWAGAHVDTGLSQPLTALLAGCLAPPWLTHLVPCVCGVASWSQDRDVPGRGGLGAACKARTTWPDAG